jgi:hypothetical protein
MSPGVHPDFLSRPYRQCAQSLDEWSTLYTDFPFAAATAGGLSLRLRSGQALAVFARAGIYAACSIVPTLSQRTRKDGAPGSIVPTLSQRARKDGAPGCMRHRTHPFAKSAKGWGSLCFFIPTFRRVGLPAKMTVMYGSGLFVTNRCRGVEPHRAARGNVAR